MIGDPNLPPPTKYQIFEDENMKTGAKWGAGIGLVLALLHMNAYSVMGFYPGSVMLLYLFCIGGGIFLGVTIGWYKSKQAKESGEFHD